jgi:hypothetical protein
MEQKYLIDTNVIIEYSGNLLPENVYSSIDSIINKDFNISVINRIEVLGHNTAGKEIEDFIDLANMFELTNDIVNKTIEIRKSYKTKLPDAIIAATVLVNDLTLITRNTKDFDTIKGIQVINPYEM